MQTEEFLKFIEEKKNLLKQHHEYATSLGKERIKFLCDDGLNHFSNIERIFKNNDLGIHYLNMFQNHVNQIMQGFPQTNYINRHKEQYLKHLEDNVSNIENHLSISSFNLYFFDMVEFFYSNIVAVGANGCGKHRDNKKVYNSKTF
jgi:hypothetical protein